jgi:hypothetical protein
MLHICKHCIANQLYLKLTFSLSCMNDLFSVSINTTVFMNDNIIQLLLVSINSYPVLITLYVKC